MTPMIIDVRTPEEYAEGHIEDAINVPVEHIVAGELGALGDISRDTPMQLYCRSGARSGHASAVLQSVGFSKVANLGGIEEAIRSLGVSS